MTAEIPILRLGRTLLVSLQIELSDRVAEQFQSDLLTATERHHANGIVIDITSFETVDSYVARILAETSQMATLMGTQTVIVGMRPEVAATLVRMGYELGGTRFALNLDEGLALLGHVVAR